MDNFLNNITISQEEMAKSDEAFALASEVVPMAPMRMVSFEEDY